MSIRTNAEFVYLAGITGKLHLVPSGMEEIMRECFDVPEKPSSIQLPKPERYEFEVGVPVSGGLDSTACYLMAKRTGKKVIPVYFDFGQEYREKELKALEKIGITPEYVDLRSLLDTGFGNKYAGEWQHIIPARNLVILCSVADKMTAGEIYFGAVEGELKDNNGGDKSRYFLLKLNTVLADYNKTVVVKTPLEHMTKGDIGRWFLDNGYEAEFDATISCFSGGEGHCGKCQACFRKLLACHAIGKKFEAEETVVANGTPFAVKYFRNMSTAMNSGDFSEYSERRCREDMSAISAFFPEL